VKKVNQTKFGEKEGNCMNACIASMLDLSIKDTPDFGWGDDWWTKMRLWLREYGYSPLEFRWPVEQAESDVHIFPNDGQICWAVGKSPRGNFKHAILVKWEDGDWRVYHDPHPDKSGLEGPIELIGMLVPIWPMILG